MECPRCTKGVLEKEGKLSFKCPKCGLFLGPLGDESGKETSPAAQDESKSITGLSSTQEVVLDSNVVTDRTVSTDDELGEGQRKRKNEVPEENPAKRKSTGAEDVPDASPEAAADVTANALQSLSLVKNSGDQQAEGPDAEARNAQPNKGGLGKNAGIDQAAATLPQDVQKTLTQKADGTFKESSGPETVSPRESETPLTSAEPSVSAHVPVEPDSNLVKKGEVHLKDNHVNSSSRETEEQDHLDEDTGGSNDSGSDESESEIEEDILNSGKDKVSQSKSSERRAPSSSHKARETKKVRKTRREEVQREQAAQKNLRESDAQDQGSNKTNNKKNNNIKKNQHASNHEQSHDKDKNGRKDGKSGDGQEQYPPAKVMETGYFGKIMEKKMTVIFHAVLAPHFKFEESQCDRIFMRFGGVRFGRFQDNVVEVFPERYLENEFLLVQATLLVPCSYVSCKVPYKYVVWKEKRDSKDKPKYLWDHLIGWGPYKNRCLQIPKDRCLPEAVWHQYDDAIFISPNWFQTFRNKMPFLKSMDPAEGRNIATLEMLPRWEGFIVNGARTNISAWEAIKTVKDLSFCMTQTQMEQDGRVAKHVPSSYDFNNLLKEFLKPKIEENALPLSDARDGNKNVLRLVSSVAIAHVLVSHKVRLDSDGYTKLFSSLIMWQDTKEKTCCVLKRILNYFPSEEWQNLGESIQAICRHVVREYHDLHEWLYAVPLVHFLTQASEPFSNEVLLMEEPKPNDDTWWGANGFTTKTVRERNFTDNSCPSSMKKMLSPLFELDPLFRRTFLLCVPPVAFGKIATSGLFPPVELYVTLAMVLAGEKFITLDEREAVAVTINEMTQKDRKLAIENVAAE